MKIVADLHVHSKYSRAVSQQMEPKTMADWADKKGIDLLAAADWTHPIWFKELQANLTEEEQGIFKLKNSNSKVRFMLSTEISSIYSQDGRTRRIHNLVLSPCFKTAEKISKKLKDKGCNLLSDGRPIIGLSSIELGELVWSIDKKVIIIPAHIFTPWFAMFGSKSGFDSIKECWGKFAKNIYAVETGLSSDPAMNWRIKDLDTKSIVSFSDAHSPAKLGRELTVFQSKNKKNFSYNDLASALKKDKDSDWQISYTVEFYPEEGKYHYSGHRKCEVRQSPQKTKTKGTICPVCGKPLTLGVMHRVEQLAQRDKIKPLKKQLKQGLAGYYNPNDKTRPPYIMLVPLMEILSEALNVGVTSKTIIDEYNKLIKNLGSELDILTQSKLEEIEKVSGTKTALGVEKVRKGRIVIEPGFDGVFGIVKIWKDKDKDNSLKETLEQKEQMSMF
jgi:uncharacterized protein (TIGR00375 family)